MKVLFNADDFGMTKGVTDGIITAFREGVVRSTTMMMNGLAVEHAVKLAKQHPDLKVGIHLVLSWGKPVHDDVPGLLNEQGTFKFRNTYRSMEIPNLKEVEKEWRAQIEAFIATGLPLHHIDSHHHIHGWEPLKDIVIALATEYNGPVRFVPSLSNHPEILLTESLWLDFYAEGVSEHIFTALQELNAATVEVMTHPAYVDDDLRDASSYLIDREKELDILCKLSVPEGIELL